MTFREKLKKRLHIAIGYIVIGVTMIVLAAVLKLENEFLSSFGFALVVCGLVRVRNYRRITKSDETVRRQEIAETDERNIAIANRAKSWAFSLYVFLTCVLVIMLEIVNWVELATVLAGSVCALVLLYWGSYWVIRRRS